MDISAETIRRAQALYRSWWHNPAGALPWQRRRGLLVGTAALRLHGYADVDPSDVDFVCSGFVRVPDRYMRGERHDADRALEELGVLDTEQSSGLCAYVDDVRVHYVDDSNSANCYAPRRFLEVAEPHASWVDGVRVASVGDVLRLKFWADREKDVEFLEWFERRYGVCGHAPPSWDPNPQVSYACPVRGVLCVAGEEFPW